MNWLDQLTERSARAVAKRSSRRGFLTRLSTLIVGGSVALPLLPVARGQVANGDAAASKAPAAPETGDPRSCDYWRYCAIDGFLCSCCGGDHRTCPPGTKVSPVTWIGTCHNPVDGKDYVISYNDCCGKSSCGQCFCNRNEGDLPIYRPWLANDLNWCVGSETDIPYHCTVSLVLGLATEEN